jgi:hypothetical protein
MTAPEQFEPMVMSLIDPRPNRLSFDRVGAGRGGGPPEESSLGEAVYKSDSFHVSHASHVEAHDNLSAFIAGACGARLAYVRPRLRLPASCQGKLPRSDQVLVGRCT